MRTKHWKLMSKGAMVLAIATLSAGCGAASAQGNNSSGVVTITLSGWTSSPVEAQLMTKELGYFEKAYPKIHVNYRPISGNYEALLKTRFVAGDAPDVIYVNNGGESSTFIANKDLIPLNHYIKSSHFPIQDFYSSALSLFSSHGQIYGIPKDQSPLALFYNKTLFQKAGITAPPTTWAELAADAKALTKPALHQYGLINSVQEPRWAEFLLESGGGVMNAAMTRMTLTSPASLQGYRFFVNLYRDHYATTPPTVGAQWGGQAFGMGDAGMVVSGNWLVPFLNQTYPHTQFGIVPMPKGPVNAETLTFPVAYGITKDSLHPQASWTLIRYLTSKQGMTKWMNLGLALPVRPSLINLPYYAQHPVLQGLIADLPQSQAWTFPPGFVEYVTTTMTNQTTLVIDGRESARQALKVMQQDGTQLLGQ